jgi:chitodextrinase
MAYNRNPTWKNFPDTSTVIKAEHLENIETGLQSAAATADTAASTASAALAAVNAIPASNAFVVLAVGQAVPDPPAPNTLYLRLLAPADGSPPPAGDTTAPTVPTGLASSSISPTGFTVSWTASTDAVGVTGYRVRLNGGTPTVVTGTSTSFTGLTASTTYTVEVAAGDAAGNWSAYSTALSVTTGSSADTTAPSVPTGLASSAITQTGFTFSWSASTDNVAVTGYDVTINGGAPIAKTTTSHAFTGLTAGTTYSVTVRAKDAAGNASAYATALSVTTSAATPTNASIYGSSAPQGTLQLATDGPARLAMAFYTTNAGGMDVVGARFYIPAGAPASFLNSNISIWSQVRSHTAGTALLSGDITSGAVVQNPLVQPLTTGWNEVLFATPVHVNQLSSGTGNAIWIETYYASNNNYIYTNATNGGTSSTAAARESATKSGVFLAEATFPRAANNIQGSGMTDPSTLYPIDLLVAP